MKLNNFSLFKNMLNVVKILFLLLWLNAYAHKVTIQDTSFLNSEKIVDSLYSNHEYKVISVSNAQEIIDRYNRVKAKNKDFVLTNEELKWLAISYSTINDAPNTAKYLEKYIKKSNSTEILNNSSFDHLRGNQFFEVINYKFAARFNFWFIFYFYTGLIGLFIALILNLKKSEDRIANLLISLFVLFSSLFIIHVWVYLTNIQFKFPNTLFSTFPLNFLYGPLLYFYVKKIGKKYKFKVRDLLHLLPFLVITVYFMRYFILSANDKLSIMYNRMDWNDTVFNYSLVLKVFSLLIYGFLVYKEYLNFKKGNQHKNIELWIRNVVLLNVAFVLTQVFYLIEITGLISTHFFIHPQMITLSIVVLFVGYTSYVQPDVFSNKYQLGKLFGLKYRKSRLTVALSNELKNDLLKLFYQERIYIINDINLKMLSERLGTDRHSTSQVINEHFKMNFFNLINKFRIQEAQDIFKKDKNGNLSIIDVAYDVGYNNKVTFNKAFKKETKLTPSQFINKLETPFNHLA